MALPPGPLTLAQVEALIRRYGPLLRLHPEESYKMSSVEWFLGQASLVRDDKVVPWDHTAAALPTGPPDDAHPYWLTLPEAARPGDQASATSYVNVKPSADGLHTWLQFWFFFPYNGPGVGHINGLLFDRIVHTDNVTLGEFGAHTGDWEHVSLGIENASSNLVAVYFSQHDGGQWVTEIESLERHGEQVVVYSSKNGHASYPHVGANYTHHYKVGPAPPLGEALEFFLRNDTAAKGDELDCSTKYVIVSGPSTTDARWLDFPYRWGPKVTAHLTDKILWDCLKAGCGPVLGTLLTGLVAKLAGPLLNAFVTMGENGPAPPEQHAYWNDPGVEK